MLKWCTLLYWVDRGFSCPWQPKLHRMWKRKQFCLVAGHDVEIISNHLHLFWNINETSHFTTVLQALALESIKRKKLMIPLPSKHQKTLLEGMRHPPCFRWIRLGRPGHFRCQGFLLLLCPLIPELARSSASKPAKLARCVLSLARMGESHRISSSGSKLLVA